MIKMGFRQPENNVLYVGCVRYARTRFPQKLKTRAWLAPHTLRKKCRVL
ncbi:hypothetical protein ACKLNO_03025 [Neisseriaceae bacterium B1]